MVDEKEKKSCLSLLLPMRWVRIYLKLNNKGVLFPVLVPKILIGTTTTKRQRGGEEEEEEEPPSPTLPPVVDEEGSTVIKVYNSCADELNWKEKETSAIIKFSIVHNRSIRSSALSVH